jgi:hypothetical protein
MNPENSKYLETVYPKIFSGKYGGFSHGDGWFNILNMLCRNIQSHLDWKPEVEQVVVQQVKEKFGSLRFYYTGGDDYIRGLVSMAEAMSEVTCEDCGAPATKQTSGWIKNVCNLHYVERETKKHLREGFEE